MHIDSSYVAMGSGALLALLFTQGQTPFPSIIVGSVGGLFGFFSYRVLTWEFPKNSDLSDTPIAPLVGIAPTPETYVTGNNPSSITPLAPGHVLVNNSNHMYMTSEVVLSEIKSRRKLD